MRWWNRDRSAVFDFYAETHPRYVILAAAKVGGILANATYPADFMSDNIRIQVNVLDAAKTVYHRAEGKRQSEAGRIAFRLGATRANHRRDCDGKGESQRELPGHAADNPAHDQRRNERRDREVKLKLYSRRGVLEYWIVDWQQRKVEVYRRQEQALHLVATLYATDTLTSPMLPGFACPVTQLFGDTQPLR